MVLAVIPARIGSTRIDLDPAAARAAIKRNALQGRRKIAVVHHQRSAAGVDVMLSGPMPTPAVAYLTRALRLQVIACAVDDLGHDHERTESQQDLHKASNHRRGEGDLKKFHRSNQSHDRVCSDLQNRLEKVKRTRELPQKQHQDALGESLRDLPRRAC